MYHSGVQVGGNEYTFAGGSGVFSHSPKDVPPPASFRESVELGTFSGSSRDMDIILDDLRRTFTGDSYNLLLKNCNHFSEAFVQRLLGISIPAYVNRMAYMGGFVSCFLPPEMTGQAPVDSSSSATVVTSIRDPFSGPGHTLATTTSAATEVHAVKPETVEERRARAAAAANRRLGTTEI